MSTEVLELNNLSLAYDSAVVCQGIDLLVHPGEWVSILGPSGCGKSSILRSIAGFLAPHNGSIRLEGRLADQPPHQRGVGMVFQDFALFHHMTVYENVAFGLHGRGDGAARTQALLERCELDRLADRYPAQLSGGQQQRVALARALAPQPKLLLLDEPFANLDADLRGELGTWCAEQIRAESTAALMVTHDRAEAMALSDRVAVMSGAPGAVLQQGPARELYQRPAHSAVALQLGEAMIVPARAAGGKARSSLGEHDLIEPQNGSVSLVFRPENVIVEPDSKGQVAVTKRFFAQGQWQHVLTYDDQRLVLGLDERLEAARVQLTTHGPVWAIP